MTLENQYELGSSVPQAVMLTPEQAKLILEGNTHNRVLRRKRVLELAAAIRRGEWQFNGATITTDPDGNVIDGQHRLWAIVEAGLPVPVLLVSGISMKAQDTVDTGIARRPWDVLTIRGVKNAKNAAATARTLLDYETKNLPRRSINHTLVQIVARYEQTPDAIQEGIRLARLSAKTAPLPESSLSAMYVIAAELAGFDAVETFSDLLRSGAEMQEDHPVMRLREYAIKEMSRPSGRRSPGPVLFAVIVKAWNAWRDDRPVKQLRFRLLEPAPEEFPIVSP